MKSKHIANGKVKNKDLKRNTIKTGKVRNGTLRAADFAPGEFPGTGPEGPQGEPGEQGEQGPPGPGARWAIVAADGTILAQSGGITVDKSISSGNYFVGFGESLLDNAIHVTLSAKRFDPGSAHVAPCGGTGSATGIASTCSEHNTNDFALVTTYLDGNPGAATDRPFYISVLE